MKKAVFPGLLSFVLVILTALFIGGGIHQSDVVEKKHAAGNSVSEVYSFFGEPELKREAVEESFPETITEEEPVIEASSAATELHSEKEETSAASETYKRHDGESAAAETDAAFIETIKSDEKPAAEANAVSSDETVVNAVFGAPYIYNLKSSSSVITFNFSVTERGALSYALTPVTSGAAGNWNAVNVLSLSGAQDDASSPNIGLMPGNYVIKLIAGERFSDTYFILKINFAPSTAYEIEYNDAPTRYTEIIPGIFVRGSASYYASGHDTDWFMFRNYSDSRFSLSFSHEPLSQGTVAFKISLFDSDFNELYSGNSLLSSELISSESIGLPEGYYFISVESRVYTGVDYILSLSGDETYRYETEYNDSALFADVIMPDEPVRGAVNSRSGSSDRDFFSFTLESRGYITARLVNTEPASDFDGYNRRLTIVDRSRNIIYSSLCADNAESVVSPFIGLAKGTYFFIIDDGDLKHTSSDYELSFSFTETSSWEMEYNNAPEYATAITENIAVSGTVSDAGTDFDTDYYAFTALSAGNLKVNLRHDTGGTGNEIFRVTVYNENMEQIGSVLGSLENSDSVSEVYAVTQGRYYIKVTSGRYTSSVRYYLTCTMEGER